MSLVDTPAICEVAGVGETVGSGGQKVRVEAQNDIGVLQVVPGADHLPEQGSDSLSLSIPGHRSVLMPSGLGVSFQHLVDRGSQRWGGDRMGQNPNPGSTESVKCLDCASWFRFQTLARYGYDRDG